MMILIVAFGENVHRAQTLLTRISVSAAILGLLISGSKPEVLFLVPCQSRGLVPSLNGKVISSATAFAYTGSMISHSSASHEDILARIGNVTAPFVRFRTYLCELGTKKDPTP